MNSEKIKSSEKKTNLPNFVSGTKFSKNAENTRETMKSQILEMTHEENSKYDEIQIKDNQMMILEIMCQKVVNEINVLVESIDVYKNSLTYLKEYKEKRDLLYKVTHLSGLENEMIICDLRERMVSIL